MKTYLLVLLSAISAAASAGPYTDALKVTKFCAEAGRTMGERAFASNVVRQDMRKTEAQILAYRTTIKKNSTSSEAVVAKALLPTEQGSLQLQRQTLAKFHRIYVDYVSDVVGKPFLKLAEKVWTEVSRVDDADEAEQLGVAVCMDYFL